MAQCGTRCLGDTMRAVLEIFLRNAPNGKIVVLNDQHCDEIVAHQTQNATQPGNVYPRWIRKRFGSPARAQPEISAQLIFGAVVCAGESL